MLGLVDGIKLRFSTLHSEELRGDFRNKWEKIRIWMVTRIFQSLPGGPERRSKHLERGEREHTRHRRNGIQPGRENPPRTAPKQQEKYRKGGKPCCYPGELEQLCTTQKHHTKIAFVGLKPNPRPTSRCLPLPFGSFPFHRSPNAPSPG